MIFGKNIWSIYSSESVVYAQRNISKKDLKNITDFW